MFHLIHQENTTKQSTKLDGKNMIKIKSHFVQFATHHRYIQKTSHELHRSLH